MSLRIFHIIFIVASIILSLYVGVWGLWRYQDAGGASWLAFGVLFLSSALVLVEYGRRTFQKLKEL